MFHKFFVIFFLPTFVFAAKIDPKLSDLKIGKDKTADVLVLLHSPKDISPQKYKSAEILNYLEEKSKLRQLQIQKRLKLKNFQSHWINHSFSANVSLQQLQLLSQEPEVKKIYKVTEQKESFLPAPSFEEQDLDIKLDDPYYFETTQLNQVIQDRSYLQGQGVLIGSIDTGVDASHPLLQGKVTKFWNAREGKVTPPVDFGWHGTHTAGVLVGGNYKEAPLGIAPKSKLIVAGALIQGRVEYILQAMQFMMNPDGDQKTNDFPKVINNSFKTLKIHDQEPFYRALSAMEALGITTVFSAGNQGPKAQSITNPKEHPFTITVGAIDKNSLIYERSSRGPAIFQGRPISKPELVAPGKDILSTYTRKRFLTKSGTSMAAPMVTATIALMLQVNPLLNPLEIRNLLVFSSDLSPQGWPRRWDPAYGFGLLNIHRTIEKTVYTQMVPDVNLPTWALSFVPQLPQRFSPSLPQRESLNAAMEFPQIRQSESKTWISSESFFDE